MVTSLRRTARAIVLFDGDCPLCRRSVAVLARLDWLHQLSYQDARQTDHLPSANNVPLDPQRLLEEMHVLPPGRDRVFTGFYAFRWLALRLPLFWAVVPFLYLPGVPWLGRRAYLWVARNRFHLVPCHNGLCAIRPQRP
jgi:predicted DCC family thiol-disulfide oxidoreductase YuxK